MQQSFAAGTAQRIAIAGLKELLRVRGWDQQTIQVDSKGSIAVLQVEGDTLVIRGCEETLDLSVPYETIISASHIDEKVWIENVRRVEIQDSKENVTIENIQEDVSISNIAGSVVLKNIKGTATIGNIDDDLSILNVAHVVAQGVLKSDAFFSGIGQLEVKRVKDSASLQNIEQAVLGKVDNNLKVQGINILRSGSVGNECKIEGNQDTDVTLESIGNNLVVKNVTRLQATSVGNDCQIQDSTQATINLGTVGNNLTVDGAAQVQIRNTGDNCRLRDIREGVTIGHVGNTLSLEGVGGDVVSGHIGGDARLQGIHGNINLGNVGANIYVQADFPAESNTHLHVGGNARVVLPEEPNLTIRATAGGAIRGYGVTPQTTNHHVLLQYGEGAAQLDVTAGGSVEIHSNSEPVSSSSKSDEWWHDFMHEMADFERSMSQMGRDLEEEIAASLGNMAFSLNEDIAQEVSRNAERQRRRVEKQQRKAEEHARRFSEKMARMSVRINDREWRMDPERINRIIDQANKAAAEGVYGAIEAVEQAFKNIRVTPPVPPVPPVPPMPPMPPQSPIPPTPPTPGAQENAATRQAEAERAQPEVPVSPVEDYSAEAVKPADVNPEQEREAILRMIAEGRITPDEGDMLLEALGS